MHISLYRDEFRFKPNSIQDVIEVLRDVLEFDCVLVHGGSITCSDCAKSNILSTARYLRDSREVASAWDSQYLDEYDAPFCCDSCLDLLNYDSYDDWLLSWDFEVSHNALVDYVYRTQDSWRGTVAWSRRKLQGTRYVTLKRYVRYLVTCSLD